MVSASPLLIQQTVSMDHYHYETQVCYDFLFGWLQVPGLM